MSFSANDSRTLWVGDLDAYMDERFFSELFQPTGHLVSVKIMRDKTTQLPLGYGFIEFTSHDFANQIISKYNGKNIPGTQKIFRMNWGVVGGGNKGVGIAQTNNIIQQGLGNTVPSQGDCTIYVGDLDPTVTDVFLFDFYHSKYKSTISAKVIIDSITQFSKGYGFVKFSNVEEGKKAQIETNGIILKGRHIKTNTAQLKTTQMGVDQSAYITQVYSQMVSAQTPVVQQSQLQQTQVQQPIPNLLAPIQTQLSNQQMPQMQLLSQSSQQLQNIDPIVENNYDYINTRFYFNNFKQLLPY